MKSGYKNKVLEIALSKVKPVYHLQRGQWYGQITSQEYMELVKLGARHSYYTGKGHLDYIEGYIKRGEGGKHCIYFTPTGELREMLGRMYPNHDERGHW